MEREVQPPTGTRPEGLPESPAHREMKAHATRDEALAKLLEQLTELASLGTTVLQELLAQAAEEREERKARQQAGPAHSRGGFDR